MKRILCVAVALSAGLWASGASASDVANVKAAVRHLIADANSRNDEAFKADLTEPALFIDEYAPFDWIGAKDGWLNAYNDYNRQTAVTDAKTKPLAFRHVNVSGDRAYVVLHSLYTYREARKAQKEPGVEVFTLVRANGKWLANGYAWLSRDGIDTGADATAIVGLVRGTFDQFNAGKADPATLGWKGLIDEFPRYNWQGPAAASDWFADFGKSVTETGESDPVVALGTPTHLSVVGNSAYVVFPAVLTAKFKGKPGRETGSFVFALDKASGTWRVDSWAWATD
jgi:hypothetical protein